ncbi:MAG: ATP-binding cassette domain-containing protein [Veillonella sp.]
MTFTTEKRLGLVGINGTGKSTFLKILAGQMEADKGTIERNGKASIYYLAQTPDFDAKATLLEAVLDGNHPRLQMVKAFERISREYRQMQESGKDDAKISRNYMNALEQMDQQDGWQVEQEARIILSKLGFPDVEQKGSYVIRRAKASSCIGASIAVST